MPIETLDEYIRRKKAQEQELDPFARPGGDLVQAAGTGSPTTNPYLAEALKLGLTGAHARATSPALSSPSDRGPLSSAWNTLTTPFKVFNGAFGNVGGRLGGLISPTAYQQAEEENRAAILQGEDRPLSTVEEIESLPGLGDVTVAGLGLDRDGISGRLVRPVTQLGLNILGDPTTYVGGLGALTKVGRAKRALAAAQEAGIAAEAAGDVSRAAEIASSIPTLAGEVSKLSGSESTIGRGARAFAEAVDPLNSTGTAVRAFRSSPSFAGAAKVGLTLPFGPVAGVAYAPELVEGVGAGLEQTAEDLRAGRLKEAAASAGGTLLTTALGTLVAKGLVDEGRAARALERGLASQLGEPAVTAKRETLTETGAPRRLEDQITEIETETATRPEEPPPPAAPAAPVVEPVPAPPEVTPTTAVGTAPVTPSEAIPVTIKEPVQTQASIAEAPPAPVLPSQVETSKLQSLSDLLDTHQAAGTHLTIGELESSGIITPSQAAAIRKGRKTLTDVLGSEIGARLELVKGKGYQVKESGKNEPASPSPGTTSPALETESMVPNPGQDPASTLSPSPQVESAPLNQDQLRLQAAHDVYDQIAQDLGVTPTKAALKADSRVQALDPAQRQELYIRAAREARAAQDTANLERVKQNPAPFNKVEEEPEIPTPIQTQTQTQAREGEVAAPTPPTPTAIVPEQSAGGASPALVPQAPAVESKTTPGPGSVEERFKAVAGGVPERVGQPLPRDLPVARAVVPNPAPTRGGETRAGVEPGTVPRVTVLPDLEHEVRVKSERATSPEIDTESALSNRVRQAVARSTVSAPDPGPALDSPSAQRALTRLTGSSGTADYAPDSPAGRVQAELRSRDVSRHRGVTIGFDQLHESLDDTLVRWAQDLERDPARHKVAAAEKAAGIIANGRSKTVGGKTLSPQEWAQRVIDKGNRDYDAEMNRRRLLLDEPDSIATRTEIEKLLKTTYKNAAASKVKKEIEQKTMLEARSHLAAEAYAKMGETAIEIPREATRPQVEARPQNLSETEITKLGEDQAIEGRARDIVAWATQKYQKEGPVRTGGPATDRMSALRELAQSLGLQFSDRTSGIKLGNKISKELDRRTGKTPQPSVVPELLTNEIVATKGDEWSRKIARAAVAPDTGVRTLSLTGEGDRVVPIVTQLSSAISDPITRMVSDLATATEMPTRFAGHITDPQLNGVRMGDDAYLNMAEMYRQARAESPNATPADLAQTTARRTVDNALHEIAHRKARHDASTGDQAFIQAYAQALEDAGPLYREHVDNLARAIEPHLELLENKISPLYNKSREDALASLARSDAGSGQRRITPIPGRPSGGTGSAGSRVQPGLQRGGDVSEGGRAAAGGRRESPEPGERVPEGAGSRPGSGRGGRSGPGSRARDIALIGRDAYERGAGPSYHEQRYPHSQPVKVTFPDGQLHFDEVKGLNSGHALARAGANWPGAKIERATPEQLKAYDEAETRAPEPHASLVSSHLQERRDAQAQATLNRVQNHFAVSLANSLGLPQFSPAEIQAHYARVSKMAPAERAKLRSAGPSEPVNIRLRMAKYADAWSPEQIEVVAHMQDLLESLPNSVARTPLTVAHADAQARLLFDSATPEELIKKMHAAGVRTVPEFVALRTALTTMGEAVDDARELELQAYKNRDPHGIADAQRQSFLASYSRDLAISALTKDSRAAAQKLVMLKTMARALDPHEQIRSRFMGAMRVSKLPEAKVNGLWSMVEDILKQEARTGAPGTGDWYRFHQAFREATKASNFDKFLEFWKAGLFGFPTHVANTASNAAFFGLRTLESGISSIANAAIAGVTGSARDRYIGEIAARNRGLRHAVGDAFSILKGDLYDALTLQEPNIARKISEGSFHDDPNFRQLYGSIEGKPGEFVRIPFKLLDAADSFFKHILRTQEYSVQAHRLALNPETRRSMGNQSIASASDQIFRELQALSSDPMKNVHLSRKLGYMDALKAGRKVAIDDTFQAPLTGVMKSVDKVFTDHPSLQLLAPFRKTPYNILAEGMKRTPLGAISAMKDYAAGKIDRPEMVVAMTKSAIGTALMGVVAGAALEGSVTGTGPADPKKAELLKKTGWQPYSIRIPGAPGQPADYISYKRLEPFATFIGLAADMAEAWSNRETDTANELMDKAIMSGSSNILDKSFLTGIESLIKILTNAGGSRASAIKQLQASLVPNVVGVIPVGAAASAIDPNYRETEAGTLSPFTAKIPGLSTTLQPQYSPTGEIRTRPGSPVERLLSPFTRSTEKTDPVAKAARELSRLGRAPDSPPAYLKVGEDKVYYEPEERQLLAQAQALGMAKVAEIIGRPGYERLPDADSIETGTKRKTKGDVVHEILEKYVSPVRQRINRQALRRARSARSESRS